MENKSFEIFLNKRVLKPLRPYIERRRLIVEELDDKVDYFKIAIRDFTFTNIYDLGHVTCSYAYNWNRNLEKKIEERSGFNFLGKRVFSGTDEEKQSLNEIDKNQSIDFPDNYFDNFVFKLKNANKENSILEEKITFEVMLDFEDSTSGINNKYNELFNTGFKIQEVYLNDSMHFAKIEATKVSLIDIFCFGYMVTLADQRRLEKIRNLNKQN
jgi:hypothetical protein